MTMHAKDMAPGPAEPLSPENAGELLTLQRAAYMSEAQLYNNPFLPPLVQTLADLTEELAGPCLGIRVGSRLVGAVRWTLRDGTAHVGRLVVAPDMQGKGIGTRLLRAVETASGVKRFALFTGHLSAGNLRLYQREGYAIMRSEPVNDRLELVHLIKEI